MASNHHSLFTTPLMAVDPLITDPAVNQRLKELILAKRDSHPGVSRSNRHGWESGMDFHLWDDDAVRTLRRGLHRMFLELTARETGRDVKTLRISVRDSALANVGERGAYHIPHIHRNCSWSAVYYVDVPTVDADPAGELELLDPRTNPIIPGVHERKQAVVFKPRTGLAVCFPSWLEHWVRPWESDAPRISVAWNVIISGIKTVGANTDADMPGQT